MKKITTLIFILASFNSCTSQTTKPPADHKDTINNVKNNNLNNREMKKFDIRTEEKSIKISDLKTMNDEFWPVSLQLAEKYLSASVSNMMELKNLDFDFLDKNAEKTQIPNSDKYEYDCYFYYKQIPGTSKYTYSFPSESNVEDNVFVVSIFGNKKDGFYQEVISSISANRNQAEYYPNGQIKAAGRIIDNYRQFQLNSVKDIFKIGIWKYYDKNGNLIKEINEDEQYGKFGYKEVLAFLYLNKYIKFETGYRQHGLDIKYDFKNKNWNISLSHSVGLPGDIKTTYFDINGITGEIIRADSITVWGDIM